jgi:hypothetical protein
MKNRVNTLNLKTLIMLALLVIVASCSNNEQDLSEEDLNSVQDAPIVDNLSDKCSNGVKTRRHKYSGTDVNKRVSAYIDDRSCNFDYTQTKIGSNTWGVYRIQAGLSTDNLQPRIERQGRSVTKVKSGNFVEISGTCRIKSTGGSPDASGTNSSLGNNNGTYILQAKGKHRTASGRTVRGSKDPAICLFVAKPIRRNGKLQFDIYREQIKHRGGSGSSGRVLSPRITTVGWNKDFKVVVRTGFDNRGPNGALRHYVNATINGKTSNFAIKESGYEFPTEAKLRFGAYRCKSGKAEILWRSLGVQYRNN